MKPLLYLITLLLTKCFFLLIEDDVSQQKKCAECRQMMASATELITVSIPSMVSQTKLEITLPRCFFNEEEIKNEMHNNQIERTFIHLWYPLATFSDFPNNKNYIDQCPNSNQPLIGLLIESLEPIKVGGQKQLLYGNYWLKYSNSTWPFRLEEERNNQALYTKGVGEKLFTFVNQSDRNSEEDIQMEFWPNKPNNKQRPTFESQIDIRSVMKKEFNINYTVFASPIFHNSNPSIKGAQFADDLLTIYQNNESLLDHPEVLDGFINNNNNILKYLNNHTKIVNNTRK